MLQFDAAEIFFVSNLLQQLTDTSMILVKLCQ